MTHDWGNEDVSMRAMKYTQRFLFKASMRPLFLMGKTS